MEKITCPNCNETIPAGRFCPRCGAELTRRCARCRKDMSVTDRYCQHCGQDNSPEAVVKLIDERETKQGKYLAFPRKLRNLAAKQHPVYLICFPFAAVFLLVVIFNIVMNI